MNQILNYHSFKIGYRFNRLLDHDKDLYYVYQNIMELQIQNIMSQKLNKNIAYYEFSH